jgi:hypothetical protein
MLKLWSNLVSLNLAQTVDPKRTQAFVIEFPSESTSFSLAFGRTNMVHSFNSSPLNIEQMVNKITASGRISRADQHQFMRALLAKNTISSAEEAMVNRVFELLRAGRLRVVD